MFFHGREPTTAVPLTTGEMRVYKNKWKALALLAIGLMSGLLSGELVGPAVGKGTPKAAPAAATAVEAGLQPLVETVVEAARVAGESPIQPEVQASR